MVLKGRSLWLLSLFALWSCDSISALNSDARTRELAQSVQVQLARSIESEKRAVLATTVDDAVKFAQESRIASEALSRSREALEGLLNAHGSPHEVEKLKSFTAAWKEVHTIDDALLKLAVEKTNLKASSIANHEALDELHELCAAVDVQAANHALKIHVLLPGHIASADDAEMSKIESEIAQLKQQFEAQLGKKRSAAIDALWRRYSAHLDEVLKLSRQNSNVDSLQLSMNEKREAAKVCESALDALVQSLAQRPRASR